jgi:hypothetical protein
MNKIFVNNIDLAEAQRASFFAFYVQEFQKN